MKDMNREAGTTSCITQYIYLLPTDFTA